MAETKQGLTTGQKIGVGVAVVTAAAGIAALFAGMAGGEKEEEKEERKKPFGFQGFRSRRLGLKSCRPCDR